MKSSKKPRLILGFFIYTFMKYLKRFDESILPQNLWWYNNYRELIDYASSLHYEDWLGYFSDEEDAEDLSMGVMEMTGKHKASLLMQMHTQEELDEILKDFRNEDI